MATPMTTGPDVKSDPRSHSLIMRTTLDAIRDEGRALCGWLAAVGTALLAFWVSEGTTYHQLAVGILMSSATLFVLMAAFEILWHAIDRARS